MTLVPTAARAAIGLTHAAATTLGALVLVTSLVPVFTVCMAALRARPAHRNRLSRSPRFSRESG